MNFIYNQREVELSLMEEAKTIDTHSIKEHHSIYHYIHHYGNVKSSLAKLPLAPFNSKVQGFVP